MIKNIISKPTVLPLLGLTFGVIPDLQSAAGKPNVLLILTDDQDYSYIGFIA